MKKLLVVLVGTLVVLAACRKNPKTPETAFKAFSLAAKMGSSMGLEKFGEKDYIQGLQNSYDSLAMMSEIWPTNTTILKSSQDTGISTLDVEAQNALGKTVRGTFKMRHDGTNWKVFEGDWTNLLGRDAPPQDASETQNSESQEAE